MLLNYANFAHVCNHKLPVERGRYTDLPRHLRYCEMCTGQVVGDEMHFALECKGLACLRKQYLNPYFCKHPNVIKFRQLFQEENCKLLCKLIDFITQGNKYLK